MDGGLKSIPSSTEIVAVTAMAKFTAFFRKSPPERGVIIAKTSLLSFSITSAIKTVDK